MPMVTRSPKDLRPLAVAGSVLLAFACGHTDPFSTPPFSTDQPFDPTPPVQLTLNQGADRSPSWLPDGSGIIYSSQPLGRPDGDVCLAELPPSGGTQRRLVCDLSRLGSDTNNAIESPVVAADGRLAFLKASSSIGGTNPFRERLAVAPGLDAANATEVQAVPYTPPGEPTRSGVQALRWLDPSHLIFVGGLATLRRACPLCVLDSIATGFKIDILNLDGGTVPSPLPGTDQASGVSVGQSADEIYFTLAGDSRVYRRAISTGEMAVAHDFGAAGIARDVHVVGARLAAIVGGRVSFSVDPLLGPVQWDSGGIVHVVDLATDADAALDAGNRLYRRPALSPTDGRLVVEGYPLVITTFPAPDTTVSRAGDIFLFTTP
jgi:WD40-like Beta Propeller Repeat